MSVTLFACGGGNTLDIDINVDSDQVSVDSVSTSSEKVSINLNQDNSAQIVLTRKLSDDTEQSLNVFISWEADELSLKDELDNSFVATYDKEALLAGESSTITVTDTESKIDFEINIQIIPQESASEENPIKQFVISPVDRELEVGESLSLAVTVLMNDDTEGDLPDDVICTLEAQSTVISVSADCTVTALSPGEATVTLSSANRVDQSKVVKSVVIVTEPRLIEVEILPHNQQLFIDSELQLSLNFIYSNGSTSAGDFSTIQCYSDSVLISITTDCLITGLTSGSAVISLLSPTIDGVTLATSTVEVVPNAITSLRMGMASLTLSKDETKTTNVLADFESGENDIEITSLSKCLVKSGAEFVSVTEGCEITGLAKGSAEVIAELKSDSTMITTNILSINVIVPEILSMKISPALLELKRGSVDSVKVFADYDNGDTDVDITSLAKCSLKSGVDYISVTESCEVTAVALGSAEIIAELTSDSSKKTLSSGIVEVKESVISSLRIEPSSLSMNKSDVEAVKVFADYENGETNTDVTSLVRCVINEGADSIAVTESCEITAVETGNAVVSVEFLDGSSISSIPTADVAVVKYVTRIEFTSPSISLIEDLEKQSSLLVTYSDASTTLDDFSLVKCESNSPLITVTDNCYVKAVSAGTATVSLKLFTPSDVTLGELSVDVLPAVITKLYVSPNEKLLAIGDKKPFKVLADYNNKKSGVNVTSLSRCLLDSGNSIISITDAENCVVEGLQEGSGTVKAELNDGSIVESNVMATVSVIDAKIIPSGTTVVLDGAYFGDAAANVSCDVEIAQIVINADCSVVGIFPGFFDVTATLTDSASGEVISTVVKPVAVEAAVLGDLSAANDFTFTVDPNIYVVVYKVANAATGEIYKVTLQDNSFSDTLSLSVLPDLSFNNSCENTFPAAVFSRSQVACGIQTTADDFYILLDKLNPLVGLSGTITVNTDPNILLSHGKPVFGANGAYIDSYEFNSENLLVVGQPLTVGHVPANLDGINISRYYSNIDDGNMDPEPLSGDYQISIQFDSTNFDATSVVIGWDNADSIGNLVSICPYSDLLISNDTLSCTIINSAQTHIFVEVHGNGTDHNGVSNITAVDGEIGFNITLTQQP